MISAYLDTDKVGVQIFCTILDVKAFQSSNRWINDFKHFKAFLFVNQMFNGRVGPQSRHCWKRLPSGLDLYRFRLPQPAAMPSVRGSSRKKGPNGSDLIL